MLFAIIAHDAPDSSERRPVHRPEHLTHLEELQQQGRLVMAGPLTDGTGSLIIVDVDSKGEAWSTMARDPYVQNGIFARIDIHPFLQVFPKPS